MRQIGRGVHGLWSDKQTDKQILQLRIFPGMVFLFRAFLVFLLWELLQQLHEKRSCIIALKCYSLRLQQHYLLSSWSHDAGQQHPFHCFIWDLFPFTFRQMSFQTLKPFKRFYLVSTIFWWADCCWCAWQSLKMDFALWINVFYINQKADFADF